MTILVPLDRTVASESILKLAAQAAERLQAEVQLFTVIPPRHIHGTFEAVAPNMSSAFNLVPASDSTGQAVRPVVQAYLAGPAGTMVETRDQALRRAEDAARDQLQFLAGAFSHRPVYVSVEFDSNPARCIVHAASTQGVDLLVMATHGRAGIERTLLGSVAEAVVRDVAKPVLLLGPHADPTPPHLNRLLLCLDGSPLAETILPVAAARAQALQLQVVLLRVVTRPAGGVSPEQDLPESEYLARLAKRLRTQGVDAQWEVLRGTDPAAAIAGYAELRPGAMLALSTHSRAGLRRLALGSVAMQIVHTSRAPVLVLHPHEARTGS